MKLSATLLLLGALPTTLALGQAQIVIPNSTTFAVSSDNGTNNLFIGQSTTLANGSTANTFLGAQAGQTNSSGSRNTFLGLKAGFPNTTGSNNTFVGFEAGKNNLIGSDNVFMGYNSGQGMQQGHGNTGIGSGVNAFDGEQNTYLGYNAAGGGKGLSNATAIGANARVSASNSLILGNAVNVGIGNSAPQSLLELTARAEHESGLRFTNLTAGSPAQKAVAQNFLTVSDKGDVVLANKLTSDQLVVRTKTASQWADYVFKPGYDLQPLAEVEQYIQKNGHLPGLPAAAEMSQKGMELTKLLTTLVQKNEELTLHLIDQQKQIKALQQQLKQKKARR
jgi:hypothetical protein